MLFAVLIDPEKAGAWSPCFNVIINTRFYVIRKNQYAGLYFLRVTFFFFTTLFFVCLCPFSQVFSLAGYRIFFEPPGPGRCIANTSSQLLLIHDTIRASFIKDVNI
jgi:hypothetical protein